MTAVTPSLGDLVGDVAHCCPGSCSALQCAEFQGKLTITAVTFSCKSDKHFELRKAVAYYINPIFQPFCGN